MVTNLKLRVSLVIPVYNEESYLALCLQAIAQQTVRPFEVIVVDNNSTDNTAAIAHQFPFVTVLQESRQGVAFARDRGFNAARGDIIGRTDGDTILAPDWVEKLQQAFADPCIDAVSGVVDYRDIGLKRMFDVVDEKYRHFLAKRVASLGEAFLYGVNMGVRRPAWRAVRAQVCHQRHLAEDLDLAVHLAAAGFTVGFAPGMRVSIAPRQAASRPHEFHKYVWSGPRVYAEHGLRAQRYMYPMALLVSALHGPICLLYKGYDPDKQRFSISYARRSAVAARVSPVSDLI
ncbi:MAG TPA: glycosyltransferase family 2 protein [Candidatus Saccharimonadales bacterium]|nr:glycosyltransferase family 2 protein [Candidatus Saccharimonadales bacterium]